jgi:hypothetical protein
MDRLAGIFIKRTSSDERFHVERCSSRNIELLKIKIADGSEDPVNVVFEDVELSEIEAVLKREGWEEPVFSKVGRGGAPAAQVSAVGGADQAEAREPEPVLHGGLRRQGWVGGLRVFR